MKEDIEVSRLWSRGLTGSDVSRRGDHSGRFRPSLARRSVLKALLGVTAVVISAALLGRAALVQFGADAPREPTEWPRLLNEVPVTGVDLRLGQPNNSPMVVAHPSDKDLLVLASRVDGPDFSCKLHVSGDGGRLWAPADPVPKLPPGVDKCYAPEVGYDDDGTLYYLFVGLHGAGNRPGGVFLTTSADSGRTFSTPWRVLGPLNYQVRMVIDQRLGHQGRMHLVWLDAASNGSLGGLPPAPNPIMAAYSDDGGKTFSAPVQVSEPGHQRAVAPALAVGKDHAVHILYYDLNDDARDYQGLDGPTWEGAWSLVLATSVNAGRNFGKGLIVEDQIIPPGRIMLIYTMAPPALAAGASGEVYVAWYDARNGDWDVFLRRSYDGGASWQPPVRLNDDPLGGGHHQYLPRLAVDASGRLDAVFYDRRRDPENVRYDVFYTSSMDGGRRYSPPLQLTTESSSSMIGGRYTVPSAQGLVEAGSGLGLLSRPSGAIAAWADTRNAWEPDRSRSGLTTQDVFATEVKIAS